MKAIIKHNFHWIIAVVVFFEIIIFGGIINSVGVYVIPITESLGVTRGEYALAETPYSLVSFLSTLICGRMVPRFGQRNMTFFALILCSGALVMRSLAQNLMVYSMSVILFGIGFGACYTAMAVHIIKQWFHRHQGLVLGFASMASGLGGSFMNVLLTKIIVTSSWRTALFVSAGILVVTAVVFLVVRDRPEQMGLEPYGRNDFRPGKSQKHAEDNWPGFSKKVLYRRPLFYVMCITTLLSCVCVYLTYSVVTPYFRDLGYSPEAAASFNSVMMLVLAFAKLGLGWLSDRIGGKPVAVICIFFAAVGQWMLATVTSPVAGYMAVSLFAVGLSVSTIVIPLVALPLFGHQGSTEVNSVFISLSSLAGIISTPMSNLIYDRIGTYSYTFQGAAILDVVIIGLYLVMFAMARGERKRYYAQLQEDV